MLDFCHLNFCTHLSWVCFEKIVTKVCHQHLSPAYATNWCHQYRFRGFSFDVLSSCSKKFINLVCFILECSVCNKLFDLNSIEPRCKAKSFYDAVNYDVISMKLINDVIKMSSSWRHHFDVEMTSLRARNQTLKTDN